MFSIHKVHIISETHIQQFFPRRITKYIDFFLRNICRPSNLLALNKFLEMLENCYAIMLRYGSLKCILNMKSP